MKKWIALLLCLCLAAGLVPAGAEDAPFTVRTCPLRDDDGEIGTLDLRFYADKPNIAYIGIRAYMAALLEVDLTVAAQGDGTVLLTQPNGTSLIADPAAGTVYAENWSAFQTPGLPYIGKKEGVKDTDCWWTEIRDIVYEEPPAAVTFDFAKYGIALYADERDVYLPLAVIAGLQKAMANPAIKNIIFDLTANGGGSQDLLQAIIGLFTDDVELRGCNTLTKQEFYTVTVTDRNIDGVIDEKDREVRYDFNLGVLTTRLAFSCGNLFPFMMQEKGAAVIGENTGGGSCVVQVLALSDGPVYMMSSYMIHLTTKDGREVEKGADPDIPLERTEIPGMLNPYFPRLTPGDYAPYYNDEMLDKLMTEWFEKEEAPAA